MKGVSDLAQHFLNKVGVTAVRRLRKSDNMRVARAYGAPIANKTDEITEEDIGTGAGPFGVRKIGGECFTSIEQCKDPMACTILLRCASRASLNEVERNLQDTLNGARNLYQEPSLVTGGGVTEREGAHWLRERTNVWKNLQTSDVHQEAARKTKEAEMAEAAWKSLQIKEIHKETAEKSKAWKIPQKAADKATAWERIRTKEVYQEAAGKSLQTGEVHQEIVGKTKAWKSPQLRDVHQ